MKRIITSIILVAFIIGFQSCGEKSPNSTTNNQDNFDRSSLLEDLADNVIIPNYISYANSTRALNNSTQNFISSPSDASLIELRISLNDAYTKWQSVAMFEIGKAEEINLRNYTNIYPSDVDQIHQNIATLTYNLELPSTFDEQGFPALDYLIYGTGNSSEDVVAYFLENENAKSYLSTVSQKLEDMALNVRTDWQENYRASFIENSGSSATSSLNKLVNDCLFYYEKFLRAGKVGIPAGVFSGNTLPEKVEAYYAGDKNRAYLQASLNAFQNFFLGSSSNSDEIGESFKTYLEYLDQNGTNLAQKIINQLASAEEKIALLDSNLEQQVRDDNIKMLEAYDELNKTVVLLKVDMLQAMNVKVDFVDADGD